MLKSKKMLIGFLVVMLIMTSVIGCSSKDNKDQSNDSTVVDTSKNDEVKDADNKDADNKDADNEEVSDTTVERIENSDYISKIKLITKGKDQVEIKVLENIKEGILASDLPELDLVENRTYLVFLKNEGDNIILVDGDESLVLLEGDNHELFEKINKHIHQ